jgi:hypothetical protein
MLWGGVIGISTGAILGLIGGVGKGIFGALIGGFIGSIELKIHINGSMDVYSRNKKKLYKYTITYSSK